MSFSSKNFRINFTIICCICSFLFNGLHEAHAQLIPGTGAPAEEEVVPEWPQDSLGRRTPRGTVSGFIRALADQNFEKASAYLNSEDVPEAERVELTKLVKNLLDHSGEILPYSWISDDVTGKIDDELAPSYDRVGSVEAGGEKIPILVEELKDGETGAPLWLISSESLERIATLGTLQNDILLVDLILPDILKDNLWGGVPVGQWLILLILIVCSYLLAWLFVAFILWLIPKFWKRARTEPTTGIINALGLPAKIFLAVMIFVWSSQELGVSIIIRQRFSELTMVTSLVAILILFWQLNNFITSFTEKRMTLRGQFSAVSVIMFLRRMIKVTLIVIGIIAILGAFGFNVTAGLAALGIGGIALALGAQKSMENFVGGVTLIADRPLRIGDFCKVGETVGTVEQIGMRSTQIRTLDRTIVTVPNGELSSSRIENYAHRDRFLFKTIFGFRYETTEDQMRYLLVELRKLLYAHPKVNPDPARVRFVEFAAASLNVEIFTYINAVNFDEFVEVREDLLLRMMDVVEASGTGFAFPSQTLYFAKDQGLSSEKGEKAKEKVREWRKAGSMPLPRFSSEEIEQLKDSIPYPPEGSVVKNEEKKQMVTDKKQEKE